METIHLGRKRIKSALDRHTIPDLSELIIDYLEPLYVHLAFDNEKHDIYIKNENYLVLKYLVANIEQFDEYGILIDLYAWNTSNVQITREAFSEYFFTVFPNCPLILEHAVCMPYINIDNNANRKILPVTELIDIFMEHRKNISKFINELKTHQYR